MILESVKCPGCGLYTLGTVWFGKPDWIGPHQIIAGVYCTASGMSLGRDLTITIPANIMPHLRKYWQMPLDAQKRKA